METQYLSAQQRDSLIKQYLGKTVEVIIDRPIGYVHHVKGITLHYTVNYGYLPGVMGGDGEEQDVYVLGVSEPLERFTGTIIGAIRRKDDFEDKLVAAPEGVVFTQAEIAEAVHFVEKYFDSTVDSLVRRSCGVIPYRMTEHGPEILLALQTNTAWTFPKGHMEAFERERETALRELWEETGLTAELREDFRDMVEYPMRNGCLKQVVLFLGQARGDIRVNQKELVECRWATIRDAKTLLQRNYDRILERISAVLEGEACEKSSC